ncbi:MAG: ABC transporter permease [Sideroxydans sp.]|nr:ABC transporter permease [Sideroxydans sp.]
MIRLIAKKELHSLFTAPSTWWALALLQFIFAWFFLARLDDYLQVQAQMAQMGNAPGATISIATPLASMLCIVLMMLTPLFTMRLIAEERRNQSWILLMTAPVSASQIVLGKFIGLLALLSSIIFTCGLMMLLIALGTQADFGLIASNLMGVWLLTASYGALGLYVSSLTTSPIVAAFVTIAISFGLWMLEMSSGMIRALSPNVHFQSLNVGLISTTDVSFFILFIAGFVLLTIRRISHEQGVA